MEMGDEAWGTIDEVPLGPSRVEKSRDIDRRSREVSKLAARLETDTQRSADVDNSFAKADRRAEVSPSRVGKLNSDAANASDATGEHFRVEGLNAVAGEADRILDVQKISIGCV